MSTKIYCIPGFGTDKKIFSKLKLSHPFEVIEWQKPFKNEDLTSYTFRMAEAIKDEQPILIGVSFGGMIALEIAKLRHIEKLILVSSIKNRKEMPFRYRMVGRLGLNKFFPMKKINESDTFLALANKRLGATTQEEKNFSNNYRKNADLDYTHWGINQILNWKNKDMPIAQVYHIHGDNDKIFPVKKIRPTHIVEGGTHLMIVNRATEISAIINSLID